MNLSPAMHFTLTRLNSALIQGNEDDLARCLSEVALEELLSQETIRKVRARGKTAMCIFLCTLAAANEVDARNAQIWLDCYQSIATRSLRGGLLRMPTNNILRLCVQALVDQAPLKKSDLKNAKGSDANWHDAFELSVDSRDWVTAVSLLETLGLKKIATTRWLKISRALSERQPMLVDDTGIPNVDVDYIRLARLYDLCTQAAHNAKAQEVVGSLTFLRARCLEAGGCHAEAIALLRPMDKGRESLRMKVTMARNLCKSGDTAACIGELDAAIRNYQVEGAQATQSQPQEESAAGISQDRPKDKTFNVAKASQALSDLARIFKDNELKMFLVSGTLLGYEREGKLLDHDKDIDIGVIGWESQYEICLAIQKSGLFTVSPQYLKGARAYYIPVVHNLTNMCIDMFIYYPQDGKLVTGVDFFFGYRQTFAFTPFELKPVTFLGVDMHVPQDTALNLEENFGNWRVPDASYISHLESPSTMDKGGPSFMLTARLTALGAMMNKKPVKLRKVIEVLTPYADQPLAMPAALLAHLQQACERMEAADMAARTNTASAKEEQYA